MTMTWQELLESYDCFLFDFNGTLVQTKSGKTFPKGLSDLEWIPGRLEVLRALARAGKLIGTVTNQAGAIYEFFRWEEMHMLLRRFAGEIDTYAAEVFVCYMDDSERAHKYGRVRELIGPDLYKGEERRKPGAGMILEARDEYMAFSSRSEPRILFVGDRDEDEGAAVAAYKLGLQVSFQWADQFFSSFVPPSGEERQHDG